MTAMFTPYEGTARWVDGKLQIHPVCPSGRRFVGGYIEKDHQGIWWKIDYDTGERKRV